MSVTFLSDAYQTLDTANKLDMGACCPPLIEPNVTSRVLRKHGIDDPLGEVGKGWLCSSRCPTPKLRLVDPVFQETAINRSCLDVRHCNKFYPFTRGQLKHHDPVVYCAIRDLWNEISVWDDVDDRFCNRWIKCLWTFSR